MLGVCFKNWHKEEPCFFGRNRVAVSSVRWRDYGWKDVREAINDEFPVIGFDAVRLFVSDTWRTVAGSKGYDNERTKSHVSCTARYQVPLLGHRFRNKPSTPYR